MPTKYKESESTEIVLKPTDTSEAPKNNKKWSSNIKDIKKRMGFSWSKFGRSLVIFVGVISVIVVIFLGITTAILLKYWNDARSIDSLTPPNIEKSTIYFRDGKTKIWDFGGKEDGKDVNKTTVKIDQIPKVMQLAIISLEEQTYYENETGVPWKSIANVAKDCLLDSASGGLTKCRGASGIGQQTIKLLTKDASPTLERKVTELFSSIKLNQEKTKSDILEIYLNNAPFGGSLYGVQEASKYYFAKDIFAKNDKNEFSLTPNEACYLAALPQRPTQFSKALGKWEDPDWIGVADGAEVKVSGWNTRRIECLKKLRSIKQPLDTAGNTAGNYDFFIKSDEELEALKTVGYDYIDKEKLAECQANNRTCFVKSKKENPYPHLKEYAMEELQKVLSDDEFRAGGLTVITSFDQEKQDQLDKLLKESERSLKAVGANNASGMILDGPTGEIIAMVGSLGYDRDDIKGKNNIATTAQQPGSSIKPYIYASAFANGFNPSTMIVDKKTTWDGNYTPQNFSDTFKNGPVSIRYALQNSLNIPAIKALFLSPREASDTGFADKPNTDREKMMNGFFNFADKVGVKFPCQEVAEKCDYSTPEKAKEADNAYRKRCFLATAIGGCEVTMVSHITGINTLLHDGNLRTANPFLTIKAKSSEGVEKDLSGKLGAIYPKKDAVIDPNVARQVTNVMTDYETRRITFGPVAKFFELPGWRVAAKSGTSNGPRDFWTVGGSPYYTVTLWAGHTDNNVMNRNASSGQVIAAVWRKSMEALHKDKEKKNFETKGLKKVKIDKESGLEGEGDTEDLTPKQIEALNKKSKVIGMLFEKADDFLQIKKKNIFELRTTVIPIRYLANKTDGKLFNPELNNPADQEEKSCYYLVAEFNEKIYTDGLDSLYPSDKYCKKELLVLSDKDSKIPYINPTVNSNLVDGATLEEVSIDISTANKDETIKSIEIFVDDVKVATEEKAKFSYNPVIDNEKHKVLIKANLNNNKVFEQSYQNVTFGKAKVEKPEEPISEATSSATNSRSSTPRSSANSSAN